MEQGFLMDTNVVIDYLGNNLPPSGAAFIDNLPGVISVITRNTDDFKNIDNLELLNPWEL